MKAEDMARAFCASFAASSNLSRLTLCADETLDTMPEPERTALLLAFGGVEVAMRHQRATRSYDDVCGQAVGS